MYSLCRIMYSQGSQHPCFMLARTTACTIPVLICDVSLSCFRAQHSTRKGPPFSEANRSSANARRVSQHIFAAQELLGGMVSQNSDTLRERSYQVTAKRTVVSSSAQFPQPVPLRSGHYGNTGTVPDIDHLAYEVLCRDTAAPKLCIKPSPSHLLAFPPHHVVYDRQSELFVAQWQDKRIQGELAVLCIGGNVEADGGVYAQGAVDDDGHVGEGVVEFVRRAIHQYVLFAHVPRAEVQ